MNGLETLAPLRTPRVPQPPHDPLSLLLAPWIGPQPSAGWRLQRLAGTELVPPQGVLMLAPASDAARRLTEAGGSFGGLRLPRTLAAGPDDELLLFDTARGRLLRFDACACAFQRLPLGLRLDAAPRPCVAPRRHVPLDLLAAPSAIAQCDGRVFIADTGHARVLVLARAGFVPRGALVLPASEAATLGTAWRPGDLVHDHQGRLWVLDAANGRIDRFDAQGRWQGPPLAADGAVQLMLDGRGVPVTVTRNLLLASASLLKEPLYQELDGGSDEVDWQQLRLSGLAPGCELDLAVGVGQAGLGADMLAQLPAQDWTRRAERLGAAAEGAALPLALDTGRWLRLRLVPRPGAAPASVAIEATAAVARRWSGSAWEPIDPRAEMLPGARDAAARPWQVDAQGRVFIACEGRWQGFSAQGDPLPEAQPPRPRYKRQGRAVSAMLDSGLDGCPWHRVEIRGVIPPGCSVEVRTTTAPLALEAAEIEALDDSAWCTRNRLPASGARRHDCLVLSPPGRMLWLELVLHGDGGASPCIESVLVEFPRVGLQRYLPAVYAQDPAAADFTARFCALFDATLRSIEQPLDRLAELFDPLAAPAGGAAARALGDRRGDFLSWLEGWVGVATVRELPEAQRRHFLAEAGRLFGQRGTAPGLRRQLLLLLGLDAAARRCADLRPQTQCRLPPLNCRPPRPCTPAPEPPLLLEHFKLRRWLYAGIGRLGDDAQLWGAAVVNRSQLGGNAQVGVTQVRSLPDPLRDPLLVHAHRCSVFLPVGARRQPALARAIERLLARETPAHVEVDVRWVEPRFTVGRQAMVGLDAVVARTPQGVSLNQAPLGQGTVLTAGPGRERQGFGARVGATRVGAANVLS